VLPAALAGSSPTPLFWVAIASLAYASIAGLIVGRMRCRLGVRAPYTRKTFHFLIITTAVLVQLAWGLAGVVTYGSVVALLVLYAVLRGDGFPLYEALARPTDAPRRSLFIVIPLLTTALGGVLANVIFPATAVIGYMVVGWGDAVGEPVGTRWGRHRYRVPSIGGVAATRSLEGSAAVFFVSTLAAALTLLALHQPAGAVIMPALVVGGAAAAVEAVSSHGLDNLTIQLAAAAVAWLLLPGLR
jgi:phytol kinase